MITSINEFLNKVYENYIFNDFPYVINQSVYLSLTTGQGVWIKLKNIYDINNNIQIDLVPLYTDENNLNNYKKIFNENKYSKAGSIIIITKDGTYKHLDNYYTILFRSNLDDYKISLRLKKY